MWWLHIGDGPRVVFVPGALELLHLCWRRRLGAPSDTEDVNASSPR